jgi:hypothetical protein
VRGIKMLKTLYIFILARNHVLSLISEQAPSFFENENGWDMLKPNESTEKHSYDKA